METTRRKLLGMLGALTGVAALPKAEKPAPLRYIDGEDRVRELPMSPLEAYDRYDPEAEFNWGGEPYDHYKELCRAKEQEAWDRAVAEWEATQ